MCGLEDSTEMLAWQPISAPVITLTPGKFCSRSKLEAVALLLRFTEHIKLPAVVFHCDFQQIFLFLCRLPIFPYLTNHRWRSFFQEVRKICIVRTVLPRTFFVKYFQNENKRVIYSCTLTQNYRYIHMWPVIPFSRALNETFGMMTWSGPYGFAQVGRINPSRPARFRKQ